MRLIPNNSTLLALSSFIGEGRRSPDGCCVLHLAPRGGEGLLWPVTIGDEQQWVWCTESNWCEWVAPMLSVSTLSDVPAELMTLLVEWGAPPIASFIDEVKWASPVHGCTAKRWDPVLTVRQNECELTCRLIDWPVALIDKLAREWAPVAERSADELIVTASLHIGWSEGRLSQLSQWRVGDGIRIKHAAALDERQLWLSLPGKRILIEQQETGEYIVQQLVNENGLPLEDNDDGIVAVDDLSFTLGVEIGRITVPLAVLTALKPGDCLTGLTQFNDSVRLLLQGQCIGKGNLLQMGDQWVVRIADLNRPVTAK